MTKVSASMRHFYGNGHFFTLLTPTCPLGSHNGPKYLKWMLSTESMRKIINITKFSASIHHFYGNGQFDPQLSPGVPQTPKITKVPRNSRNNMWICEKYHNHTKILLNYGNDTRVPSDDTRVPSDDARVPSDDTRVPRRHQGTISDDTRVQCNYYYSYILAIQKTQTTLGYQIYYGV